MPTLADAKKVAEVLRSCPYVQSVELFGSIAREGRGGDIDIILTVPDFIAAHFFVAKRQEAAHIAAGVETRWTSFEISDLDDYDDNQDPTFQHEDFGAWRELLRDTFGPTADDLIYKLSAHYCGVLDIFCFPPNWRQNLSTLQCLLPHRDSNFMENIAHEAVPL